MQISLRMNYQKSFIDLDVEWFHHSGLFEADLNKKDCLSKLRGQNASVAIISDGIYAEHEGLCGLNIKREIIGTAAIPIVSVGPHPMGITYSGSRCLELGESFTRPDGSSGVSFHGNPTGDAVRGTAMAGILAGRSFGSRTPAINDSCYPHTYLLPSGVGTTSGSFCPLILSGSGFKDKIILGFDGPWETEFNTSDLDGLWEKDVSEPLIWRKPFGGNPEGLTISWKSESLLWEIIVDDGIDQKALGIEFSGNPPFIAPSCTGCPLGDVSFFDLGSSGFVNASLSAVFQLSPHVCEEVSGQDNLTGSQGMIEGMASQISVLYDYPYLYKSYWESLDGDYLFKMSDALERLLGILSDVTGKGVDVLIMDLNPSIYPISSGSFFDLDSGIREGLKNKIIEIASGGTTIILTDAEFPHNIKDDNSYENLLSCECATYSNSSSKFIVPLYEEDSKNFLLDSLMPEIRPHIVTLSKIGPRMPLLDPNNFNALARWPPFYITGGEDYEYHIVASWGEKRMMNNGLCFPGQEFITFLPGVPLFYGRPISLPPEVGVDYTSGPIPGPYASILINVDSPAALLRETSHLSAAIAGGIAAIIHGFKRNSKINSLNVIEVLKGCVYPIYENHTHPFPPGTYQLRESLYGYFLHIGVVDDGYDIEQDIYIKSWNRRYGYGTTNFKLLARTLSSYLVGLNPIGDDHEEPGTSVQMLPCQREWMKKYFEFGEDPYNPSLDLSDEAVLNQDNTRSGWPDVGWPPFSTPKKDQNFNEQVTASSPEPQPSSFTPQLSLCNDNFMGWPMAVCTGSDLWGFFSLTPSTGYYGPAGYIFNDLNGFTSNSWENSTKSPFDPPMFNDKPYWRANPVLETLYSGEYIYWSDEIDKWIMSISLGGAPIEIGDEENPRQAVMDISPPLCPIGFWAGYTDANSLTRPKDIAFFYGGNKIIRT